MHQQVIRSRLNEDLVDHKINQLDMKQKLAQAIFQKYEIVTREYQNQNKQLKEKHDLILNAEKDKRGDIIKNFDEHLKDIKSKLHED